MPQLETLELVPDEEEMPNLKPREEKEKTSRRGACFWFVGSTFWTVSSIFSLVVNLALLVIVYVLASQLFTIKRIVRDEVLGGLYANFILMDQASIKTTIPVNASVPAKFDLPVETETTVVLSRDTVIRGANVSLSTGGLSITNAPTDIVLPAGTRLPILLSIVVPVDQQIPVNLAVKVDIPMNKTELHTPFVGLQGVVAPYYFMLDNLPDSWAETVCGSPTNPVCEKLVR